MVFSTWADIGRVVLVGALGYIALIVLLRLSGKRTLTKMNIFDFVVTVALGSTLASLLLSKSTALVEGITAFLVLIVGQYVIAWLSVRSTRFQKLVKAQPTLLVHNGKFLETALRQERITEEEVLSAVRAAGIADLDEVGGVVLETDGTVTVVEKPQGNVYATVRRAPGSPGHFEPTG